MSVFEEYAGQSNLAHEIYTGPTAFGAWLVNNMPPTEKEVAAMRKAWEAGGMFGIQCVEHYAKDELETAHSQIAALKRLRDDLHETTNRYLDRARKAEFLAENWKFRYNNLKWNMNAQFGKLGAVGTAGELVANPYGDFKTHPTGYDWLGDASGAWKSLFMASNAAPLYLRQFGRILRPKPKPLTRWEKVKQWFGDVGYWFDDVRDWLADFPR